MQKKKYTLVVVVVLLACICVVSIGLTWTFWDSGPQTADDYASQYGGNVDVYAQILASNDCAWLQGQFDNAYATSQANAPGTVHHKRATGFMTASNTRMEEIGCYK